MSLDEAQLNVTDYLKIHPELDIATLTVEIRQKVFDETQLTCSAGAGPNRLISKTASDFNKPNGQTIVGSTKEACINFMKKLNVKKIGGIGKVQQAELAALGIHTCQDVLDNRYIIAGLFNERASSFYFASALGIGGEDHIKREERKSLSAERTFGGTSSIAVLRQFISDIAYKVSSSLKEEEIRAITISIKAKTTNFKVFSRSTTLSKATNDFHEIESSALNLLDDILPASLRLLGVRASNFVSVTTPITSLFGKAVPAVDTVCPICQENLSNLSFAAATSHVNSCVDVAEEEEVDLLPPPIEASPIGLIKPNQEETRLTCPICTETLSFSREEEANRHVNNCLESGVTNNALKVKKEKLTSIPKPSISKFFIKLQ